jgi:hypothetical protein
MDDERVDIEYAEDMFDLRDGEVPVEAPLVPDQVGDHL